MQIYILFLAFIFLYGGATRILVADIRKRNAYFLAGVFIVMYLLYALRAPIVGRDLPGYEKMYHVTSMMAWGDYDYTYFENGYIFIMKVFTRLGFSFQGFMAIVNLIILLPIYVAIKKYSSRPFLSVLVYVCYMFFEFNMTGIRQAIATSIMLLGIITLWEAKKNALLKYLLFVVLAAQFHKGAYIGLLYIPFHFTRSWKAYYSAITGTAIIFLFTRGLIMSFVKAFFEKDSMNADAGLYIGLNLVFLIGLAIMFAIGSYNRTVYVWKYPGRLSERELKIQTILDKMFLLSIAVQFLFGSDTSVRSYMLFNQVIIIHFPNCIYNIFNKRSEKIVEGIFYAFFVIFMFTNTLLANNFDIIPYRFFWQA